jgi:hypothetical protein
MSLAFVPRESSGKNERPIMAAQAAPAPAGDPLLVSRFLHGDVNASRTKTGWWFKIFFAGGGRSLNGYFLPSISSAKTRATSILRQQHIPPNVTCKAKLS